MNMMIYEVIADLCYGESCKEKKYQSAQSSKRCGLSICLFFGLRRGLELASSEICSVCR